MSAFPQPLKFLNLVWRLLCFVWLRKRKYRKKHQTWTKYVNVAKRQKCFSSDFGYYQLSQRLNVDSIPFNLDNQARKAFVPYETKDMVQISGPQDGHKRFGTIHMLVHPGSKKQAKLAMFFKGQGNVYKFEKDAYHPDVDVYFQQKAWLDRKVAADWVEKTLTPYVKAELEDRFFLLFQDNLGVQKQLMNYVRPIQKLKGECVYGPPNKTEAWQPIDAGHLAAVLKALAKQAFDIWMMKPYQGQIVFESPKQNWEVWEDNKFTMKEKRILMTWIFGDAWQVLCGPKYNHLRFRAFEKCGLCMTMSGKNDGQVISEGLKD